MNCRAHRAVRDAGIARRAVRDDPLPAIPCSSATMAIAAIFLTSPHRRAGAGEDSCRGRGSFGPDPARAAGGTRALEGATQDGKCGRAVLHRVPRLRRGPIRGVRGIRRAARTEPHAHLRLLRAVVRSAITRWTASTIAARESAIFCRWIMTNWRSATRSGWPPTRPTSAPAKRSPQKNRC